jgi:tetratricopeptide (TPR) repeat protein
MEWADNLEASDSLLDRAYELAKKCVALDEFDSLCQGAMGMICLDRCAFEMAEHYGRKALELNPNKANMLASFASTLVYLGKPDEALEHFNQARAIERHHEPTWYCNVLSEIQLVSRLYDEAISTVECRPQPSFWQNIRAAICYAHTNRLTEARRHIEQARQKSASISVAKIMSRAPFKREEDRQHYVDGLRRAGLQE